MFSSKYQNTLVLATSNYTSKILVAKGLINRRHASRLDQYRLQQKDDADFVRVYHVSLSFPGLLFRYFTAILGTSGYAAT